MALSISVFVDFIFFVLVGHPTLGFAQDFAIPLNWQVSNSTGSLSFTERALLAQHAIGDLNRLVNSSSGTIDSFPRAFQSADLVTVTTLNDWVTGSTTYESTVSNNVQAYITANPNYLQQYAINSDTLSWGITASYAYRVYGTQFFLEIASRSWSQASTYFITEAQAASGSHPARPNVTLQSTCDGATTAGGIFFHSGSEDKGVVNAETVGRFLILSAYLYNATTQMQYRTAADLSAVFLRNHLYNDTIVLDTLYLASCEKSLPTWVFSYNSGFAIQGFSLWGNVLKNDTWTKVAENLISTSVPFNAWTRPSDGVISEGNPDKDAYQNGYKGQVSLGLFIRSLHEARWLSDPASDMAKFIEQFISVQFDALQEKAYFPPSNAYDASWIGPASSDFHPYPEVTALQVLNSAISLVQRTNTTAGNSPSPSSSGTSSAATSNSSSTTRSTSHTGAIVGGAIGAVVGLLALLALGFILVRRRRQNVHDEHYNVRNILAIQPHDRPIEPFISEPYDPTSSSSSPPVFLPNGKLERVAEPPLHMANVPGSVSPPSESDRPVTSEVHGSAYGSVIAPILREFMMEITERMRAQRLDEEVSPPRYSQ